MRTLIFLFVSLLISTFQLKAIEADELLKAEKEIVAWLEKLGYQDLSKAAVVNVATGSWYKSGDEPEKNTYIIGFLTAEEGADFTVVGLTGDQTTYSKKVDVAPFEAVFFERLDLKEVVKARLESAKNKPDDHWARFGEMTSEPFETVFLARACASQGLNKEAHDLFELASRQWKERDREKSASLIDFLKKDQAHTRMWRAVLAFGTPKISRPKLLEKFEDITKNFPESKHVERAKKTVDLLKEMIEEDKVHAAKKAPPLDELEGEALVAELIYQLRNQNGQQWSQPGACDIFLDERGEESPAGRLVAIGFPAVPQLIEVIEDKRFTRSVGYHRNFYFSHHVLRVGDCAERILCRIAGRNFYQRTYTNGAMAKDGEATSIKKQVEAWWKEVKTKGEKQVLIEAVMSGDDNSAYQAQVLIEKYPDSAVEAIRKGLAKSTREWTSQQMISLLTKHGSDESEELIRQQLLDGKKLPIRITAAQALMRTGRSQLAIERMLHEWKNYSPDETQDHSFEDPQSEIAKFLLHSGSSQAVNSVAEKFPQLPARAKFEVISSLSDTDLNLDQTYVAAVEGFLVEGLQITDEVSMSGTYGDQSFSNPRVCDIAGYVLTNNWPKSYSCRLDGTERERDADRFTAINRWRSANGLNPIKVPKPFVVKIIPNEITDPLIEKIASNESKDASEKALKQLAELGPGAIEAAEKLSNKIGDSHPFAKQVQQLTMNLPNTISVVSMDNKSETATQAWLVKVGQLKGQTFSSEMLIGLLTEFAKERPCAGVRIKAIRDGNDNGVELNVEWIGEPAKRNGSQQMWNKNVNVILGRQHLNHSVGSSSLDYATKSGSYDDLKSAVDTAGASPDKHMRTVVSLIIDE